MTARDVEPLTQEQRQTLAELDADRADADALDAALECCDAYAALRAQHEALQAQMAALMPALRYAVIVLDDDPYDRRSYRLAAALDDAAVSALRAAVERKEAT